MGLFVFFHLENGMLLVSFQKLEFLRGFNLLRGLISTMETFFRFFFLFVHFKLGAQSHEFVHPPVVLDYVWRVRICSYSQVVQEFADVTLDSVETMVGKEQFVPPFPRMLELIQARLSVGGCREGDRKSVV